MKKYKKIIFGFVILCSLVCVGCGIKLLLRYFDLKNHGVKTTAILVGYDTGTSENRKGTTRVHYTKVFRFKVGNDSITSSPNTSSDDTEDDIGITKEIVYSSDDPATISEIDDLSSDLIAGIIVMVMGVLFAVVTLVVNIHLKRKNTSDL